MKMRNSKRGDVGFNVILGIIGIALLAGVMLLLAIPPGGRQVVSMPNWGSGTHVVGGGGDRVIVYQEMPKFSSCGAIATALKEAGSKGGYHYLAEGGIAIGVAAPSAAAEADSGSANAQLSWSANEPSPRYSETNVQVEGVDEADIVKTDGKYIYTLSGGRLVIAEAYPASGAEILSVVDLGDVNPREMFIDGNIVLIFGDEYKRYEYVHQTGVAMPEIYPRPHGMSTTVLQLWDASNKESPKLERVVDFEGNYLTSRKIGSTAYFVINSYPNYEILKEESEKILPLYRDYEVGIAKDWVDYEPVATCSEVGYLEPVQGGNFVIVGSISMGDLDAEVKKEVVMASGQNVYASTDNLYMAEVNYDYETVPGPMLLFGAPEARSTEETVVHKFALDKGNIYYQGYGEAPGTILNQFSMDEYGGYFRIATTAGHVSREGSGTSNNVYVFDGDMKRVGSLEDLAPGERIYSARFMGDRAYMVTFKKVDPLFAIDLSDPRNPEVLGKLKIPGYSDYLHPIDENHLIGVGKETEEAEEGDFAWYQGLKLAVFDVTDVEHPTQMYKEIIGDRGTDSYALQDHKAFLYDREKDLLVIPVLLAEINEGQYGEWREASSYGDYVFQGAYVYDLSLGNGFRLRGRITHLDSDESFRKSGYYYGGDDYSVKRSLFIGDVLYTVSDRKILANSLGDLGLLKELRIPGNPNYGGGYGYVE